MSVQRRAASASRYRQFKMLVTQEASGALVYRIYAKALNASWTEKHCVLVGSVQGAPRAPYLTTEDVILGLLAVLEDQTISVVE